MNSLLENDIWNKRWWNDTNVGPTNNTLDLVFVKFQVTRYEIGDSFGVEFYSTEGDTLRVFPSGNVYFKPQNAQRDILINEALDMEMDPEDDRRERRFLSPMSVGDAVFSHSESELQRARSCLRSPNACEEQLQDDDDEEEEWYEAYAKRRRELGSRRELRRGRRVRSQVTTVRMSSSNRGGND